MSITRSCSALPFAWEDLDEAELGGNLSWFEPSNHFGRLLSYRSSDAFGKVPGWLWVMSDFWKRPPQTQILPKKALSFCCSFVKTSQSWKMFHLLRALPGSRQLWSPFYPLVTLVWSCRWSCRKRFLTNWGSIPPKQDSPSLKRTAQWLEDEFPSKGPFAYGRGKQTVPAGKVSVHWWDILYYHF